MLDATWKQDVDTIRRIIEKVVLLFLVACATGNIEMVEMLANAWKGQDGGAIGGHGIDAVLEKHDKEMICFLVRNNLLSKVAVDIIAQRLGLV